MTLRAGDMLDSYRIVAPLKHGGMARLYLARREGAAGFAKPVAIKVIHPHLAQERDFVERFIAEARLSASIVDPNVVHVEGLGEARGTFYIAMEYVHGLSLAELMSELRTAKRRLSTVASVYIAARIASGLHAAHETTTTSGNALGIIHRDVSPQNVLIAFTGHVKVIDFGVAKAFGPRRTAGEGDVIGKLAYMAPEQARAEEIDRRADVFALGVILWELLTQARLFIADNDAALLQRVLDADVPPIHRHAPDVPEVLEAIVRKALARDAGARYATAGELARALADAMPESKNLEPAELGALLKALAPAELEAKRALLARVDVETPSSPEITGAERDPTTKVRLRPDEALAQLTLPVAPFEPPTPSPIARQVPRAALSALLVVALGAGSAYGAYAVMSARPNPEPPMTTVPSAEPWPPPTVSSLGSAATSASASASAASSASASATGAPSASETGRPAVGHAGGRHDGRRAPHRSSAPAPASAGPRSTCRIVDGVELCQ